MFMSLYGLLLRHPRSAIVSRFRDRAESGGTDRFRSSINNERITPPSLRTNPVPFRDFVFAIDVGHSVPEHRACKRTSDEGCLAPPARKSRANLADPFRQIEQRQEASGGFGIAHHLHAGIRCRHS